ncbi:hypothetical protein [Paraburkholderia tropica]|nr:hypothetical protein [Paraburkholderia tropica]
MKNLYARVVLFLIRPALELRERKVLARGNAALSTSAENEPEFQLFSM